jgi:ceramide glucosyltransferase
LLLRDTILLLALGPLVYYLLTLWAASAYFRNNRKRLLRHSTFTPPVSILKPVRGLDREAYENFASFCLQQYPVYEILFCVNTAADPAVRIIEELIRDFPERSIRLLVGAPHIGSSGKVNKLCRLAREASYDLLVISDSDVRVDSNYLRDVVAPLENPKVGAVTVLFRSIGAGSIGGTLDAVGSAVEFAASALLAQRLEGIHFALGATMATTKQRLAEIGGFEALVDRYVDDYEFGRRIATKGYQIHLSSAPVNLVYPRQSTLEFLRHELRWSIGLRNVRPLGHAAMGLTLGWLWTILAVIAAPSAFIASLYIFAYVVLRSAVYLTIGVWGLEDGVVRRAWGLVPLRDAAAFAVWIASFFSNRISWRGLQFRVKNGVLFPLSDSLRFSSTSRAISSGFRSRPGAGQRLETAQDTVDEAAISNAIGSQFPNS